MRFRKSFIKCCVLLLCSCLLSSFAGDFKAQATSDEASASIDWLLPFRKDSSFQHVNDIYETVFIPVCDEYVIQLYKIEVIDYLDTNASTVKATRRPTGTILSQMHANTLRVVKHYDALPYFDLDGEYYQSIFHAFNQALNCDGSYLGVLGAALDDYNPYSWKQIDGYYQEGSIAHNGFFLDIDYNICYADERVLSVIQENWRFIGQARSDNIQYHPMTFDIKADRQVKILDLVENEADFSYLALTEIYSQMMEAERKDPNAYVPELYSLLQWTEWDGYFSKVGFSIVFNRYDVASGMAGAFEFLITYDQLWPCLNDYGRDLLVNFKP